MVSPLPSRLLMMVIVILINTKLTKYDQTLILPCHCHLVTFEITLCQLNATSSNARIWPSAAASRSWRGIHTSHTQVRPLITQVYGFSNQKPFRRISAPASDKPVFAPTMVHMRISHNGFQNFPVAATFLLVLRSPPLFVSCLAFIFAFLCCFLLLGMEVEKESAHRSRILPFVHIHGPALLWPSQRKRWGPIFGTASALAQAASNFVSTAANRAWSELR